jgi:hypothetical protein
LLHWKNNKLKSDDFPTFNWDTSYNPASERIENISRPRIKLTFRYSFLETLSDLYPGILNYRISPFNEILI